MSVTPHRQNPLEIKITLVYREVWFILRNVRGNVDGFYVNTAVELY
jgi:hypothetical protein